MIRSVRDLRRYLETEAPRFILEEIPPNGFDIFLPKDKLLFFKEDLLPQLPAQVSDELRALPWWRCRFKKQQIFTKDIFLKY